MQPNVITTNSQLLRDKKSHKYTKVKRERQFKNRDQLVEFIETDSGRARRKHPESLRSANGPIHLHATKTTTNLLSLQLLPQRF